MERGGCTPTHTVRRCCHSTRRCTLVAQRRTLIHPTVSRSSHASSTHRPFCRHGCQHLSGGRTGKRRRRPCHGPGPPGQGTGRQAGGRHRAGAAGDLHLGARRQGRCAARDLYLHRPQLQVLPQVLGGRASLGGCGQGAAAPHPGRRDPGRQPGQGRRHPAGPGPRGRTDGAREEVRPGRHSARLQRQPRRAQDAGGPPQADDVPGLPWHAGHRGDRQPGRHQELWRHAARCRLAGGVRAL